MQQLKLHVSPGGWLITAPTSLTALQINTARQLAAAAGTTIEVKSDAPSLAQLRNYATAAGILLALGVLAMTVGLIRSETGGELRTLTATGRQQQDPPHHHRRHGRRARAARRRARHRRRIPGHRARSSAASSRERMSHVPVLDLLLILVGLPGRRRRRRMAVRRPRAGRDRPPAHRVASTDEPSVNHS